MLYMEAVERVKGLRTNVWGPNSHLLALPEGFCSRKTDGGSFGKPSLMLQ